MCLEPLALPREGEVVSIQTGPAVGRVACIPVPPA